jgi:hypothetical protein
MKLHSSPKEEMVTNLSTNANEDSIPRWIFWYATIIMIGAPLLYGIMTFMGPNLGMVTLANGSEIDTGLFKYAVRNVAAALITGYALYKRSAPMLLLVFIMRFITESGDLLDSLLFAGLDTAGVISFVAIMVVVALIPYAIAIRKLWTIVY